MTTLTWTTLFTNASLLETTFITNFRSDVDEDTADFVTDAQITQWINAGLRNISFVTKMYPEFASATCDSSAYYTLPSDLENLGAVTYIDTTGKHFPVMKVSPVHAQDLGFTSTLAKYYSREGNRLYLFGTPSTGTIRVYATRPPKTSANNSLYIDLLPEHYDVLNQFCAWKFWARRRELDEAGFARRLYVDMLEMVKEDMDNEFQHGMVMYGKKSQRI